MEVDCDYGAMLKELCSCRLHLLQKTMQLDELDAKHYAPQRKKKETIFLEEKIPFTDPIMDSNLSDFDNSDEDIASLLADDDDDIFAKKAFGSSPAKKATSNPANLSPKKPSTTASNRRGSSEPSVFNKDLSKQSLSRNTSKEIPDVQDDALNAFLSDSTLPFLKDSKKPTINKNVNKTLESYQDESKYLDELGFSHLSEEVVSPEKRKSISLTSKPSFSDEENSEDDDILKSLESDAKAPSSPRKRSGSFFDDFLKTLSPKQSPKKPFLETSKQLTENKKESTDEDIFGTYSSSEVKKNTSTPKQSTPDKKRGSFQKQVSFKDLHASLPDDADEDSVKTKVPVSPKLQQEKSESKIVSKSAPQTRRSERMGATKTDDTDWLSFFKESPKKTKKVLDTEIKSKINSSEEKDFSTKNLKSSANRRRSSTAEWLGLSASSAVSDNDILPTKRDKILKEDSLGADETLKITRPHTTESTIAVKQMGDQSVDLSWLGSDTKRDTIERKKRLPNTTHTLTESNTLTDADNLKENVNSTVVAKQRIHEVQKSEFSTISHDNIALENQSHWIQNPPTVHKFPTESSVGDSKLNPVSQNVTRAHEGILNQPRNFHVEQEIQNIHGSSDYALQILMNNHALEREQLIKSSEAMKLMYEERIKTLENLHKDHLKSLEESYKSEENRLKSEIEDKVHILEEKINVLKTEKSLLEKEFKEKLDVVKKENLQEVQRLKDLHNQSITSMKQDHEDALSRLQRLKEQEIEAVLNTQSHSRSLQQLTDQLEARAAELASLQSKVEERNHAALREKQAVLEVKERDLKNLQNRLQRQIEDGDEERTRLQQLILRLESRLQKYATEGEEDRWEVQQLKARLSVQKKHLDEEYKLNMQQVEKEKEKLQMSQGSLLHEQKTVLLQLAQERQQLMQEKMEIDSLAKKIKEEEIKLHVKKMKEESFIERQKLFIQQEESRLSLERANIKQEAEQLERERDTLQIESQMLKGERLKFNELTFKMKRKENEVEEMSISASAERERAQVEHSSAMKIKAEQQARMQQMTQKMQELMEKEKQIIEEKEKLSQERLEIENKKNSMLCNKCKLSLGSLLNVPPTGINPITVNSIPTSVAAYPPLTGITNHISPSRVDPSLIVWYITAQKDREYLQEELSFLRSLKESSKHTKK